jgi:two-component system sensor histidine kinase/response regulator
MDPASNSDTYDAFDSAELLEYFEGDRQLLREVVNLFIEDYPRRLAELRTALARGDAQTAHRAAHSLKGSVGNFAANAAVEAAARVETLSRDGNLHHALAACPELEKQIDRLHRALLLTVQPESPGSTTKRRP